MFFFSPRISEDVGSLGASRICLCPLHCESKNVPQIPPRKPPGWELQIYSWCEQPYGKSWARSSLPGSSGDSAEGQNSRQEQVPWQLQ